MPHYITTNKETNKQTNKLIFFVGRCRPVGDVVRPALRGVCASGFWLAGLLAGLVGPWLVADRAA
jgi:acyl dehydratase